MCQFLSPPLLSKESLLPRGLLYYIDDGQPTNLHLHMKDTPLEISQPGGIWNHVKNALVFTPKSETPGEEYGL